METSTATGLAIITESGLLAGNLGALEELRRELEQTHLFAQQARTRTEMEVSVLQDLKHPTADAKYWQATREQDVQYQELVLLSFEYRSLVIETKKLQRDSEGEEDDLERELLQIKIEKNEYLLRLQERTGFHRLREICEWSDIKARLAPACHYSLEDCNAHQMESLGLRFEAQAEMVTPHTPPADRMNILGLRHTSERLRATS